MAAFDDSVRTDADNTERAATGKKSIEQTAADLWRVIDDVRCSLLTPQVDDDARPIVLAIEGVIDICDSWERMRRPEVAGSLVANGEPMRDIRHESFPSSSTVVMGIVGELRNVLAGKSTTPIEGFGELLQQNVSLNQACRMHGLALPDGSPDLATLGMLIDRALGVVGFYREINAWTHLKSMGAMNAADAWAIRSSMLEERRAKSHRLPGSAQRAGDYRAGRLAVAVGDDDDSFDNQPLHVTDPKFRHFHESKLAHDDAQAEKRASDELFDNRLDDLRY